VWLQGEAAWSLLVRLDDTEVDRYLTDRMARGTNTILVNLIEYRFADDPPKNRAGVAPFAAPGDFAHPVEAYFAHVDRVLARAAELGFVVLLAPAYLGYDDTPADKVEGWYDEVVRAGPDVMRAYGRFLGARYRALPNLIWVEGGDRRPMEAARDVDALAAGILETDPVHLHTAHSTRQASALDDYDRPWLGLNTTYSDCAKHPMKLEADARRVRKIPTLFIEGRYEGEEDPDAACMISQAYRSLLSGAAGHVFGNRPIWLFDRGWPEALDSQGSREMQHLAELLASRDLRGLVPDFDGTIVRADGLDALPRQRVAVASTANGDTVVAFVEQGPRTLHVTPRPHASVAWWYDTTTGHAQRGGELAAGARLAVAAPAGGPWVLLVEDAAAHRAAPGATAK